MGDQSRALHTPPSSSSGSTRGTFQTGRKRSSSSTPRPEMQMPIVQAGHPQGQQPERPVPPRFHQYAPPPLAPYVGRDERVVPPTPSAEGWLRHDAHSHPTHPSIPPPQRPAPPHIPPPPRARQDSAPPSPPASRGQYPVDEGAEIYSDSAARTHSAGSAQSGLSASSARLDGDRSSSPGEGTRTRDHATSETAASGSSSGQTEPKARKRTRVLMTHLQSTRLVALWHENRFPSTQQREELGSEVGLTPRQVQVWFQNRRQNARKQFNQTGIPEGANVAEYEDLQKSPRSRRLSMESSAQEDRTSRWAASSSSTGYTSVSSYSRASGSGVGGGLASIGESTIAEAKRYHPGPPPLSAGTMYSQPVSRGSKSPRLRAEDRHPSAWQNAYTDRPMTALSSASLSPLRPTTYNPPHSSMYHPVLSPPPTAESEIPLFYRHHQPPMHSAPPPLRRFGSSGNLHQQRAFAPEIATTRPELKRRSLSPDIMARASNLPPSLAALMITRPRSEAPRLPSVDTPDQDIAMDGSWAERAAAATDPARFREPADRERERSSSAAASGRSGSADRLPSLRSMFQ